jgi:hypothetical protein
MGHSMKIDDVRRTAYSMPLTNPAFPMGPYRFFNREFFVITYRDQAQMVALSAYAPTPAIFVHTQNSKSIRRRRKAKSLREGVDLARTSIQSGQARSRLKQLIDLSQTLESHRSDANTTGPR